MPASFFKLWCKKNLSSKNELDRPKDASDPSGDIPTTTMTTSKPANRDISPNRK
jgi:hypothetical protein